jgi:predicted RNA-binding Zn ribbon-like protein
MEGLATDRLHVPAGLAPDGLCIVQELINTATGPAAGASHVPDLLASEERAGLWLTAALEQWSAATGQPAPDLRVAEADLAPLRRLRESVRALVGAHCEGVSQPFSLPGVSLALRFDSAGRVRYGTSASGWRGIAALIAVEILLSQHTGTWHRFKRCPYPTCGVAFYDQTRNNNRVWHDVRTCGNRTNLVVSRQRRRTLRQAPDGTTAAAPEQSSADMHA